ncbi:MAG: HAD-IA family hydrolase [Pseudomonadota bacterium]|nr:HAD-IA family hydrolase [Pseudomonadota bacterium]
MKKVYPVKLLCRLMGVGRSGFYEHLRRRERDPDPEHEEKLANTDMTTYSAFARAAWGRDAILVDFDGTLYHQAPVRMLMALELLLFGPGVVQPLRRFRIEQERLRRLPQNRREVGDTDGSPFQRQLINAAADSGITPEKMQAIVEEWMFRRPGKWLSRFVRRQLVGDLRASRTAGVKLAVVSDYPVRRKLAALTLPLDFDVLVANGEPGGPKSLKPDPEGYLLAAENLGAAPPKCLVVGDRDDVDGVAARRAGMSFLLVR